MRQFQHRNLQKWITSAIDMLSTMHEMWFKHSTLALLNFHNIRSIFVLLQVYDYAQEELANAKNWLEKFIISKSLTLLHTVHRNYKTC